MRIRTLVFIVLATPLILLSLVVASPCLAQVATGTPPFSTVTNGPKPVPPRFRSGSEPGASNASPSGSLAGGPDNINLGNLNAHITVPVVHKSGRGINFTYDMSYDSSVWFPVGSSGSQSWQPVTNWGWRGQTEAALGGYTYTGGNAQCWTLINGHPQVTGNHFWFTGYVYHDSWGISHHFYGTANEYTGTGTGCDGFSSNGFTSVTNDGSGFTINVYSDGGATLTSRDGSLVNPSGSSGASTDRNGNEITVSGNGVFTDTLGQTALTVAGSAPNPTTFSYTAPSGASASYTVKYAAHTVKTNFGCSGVSEFGPTSENLVSEIDLPDIASVPSDKYTFTYEPTTGFSGDVTGRLASVTLPTGGTITYTYTGGNNGIECVDGSTRGLTRATSDGTWSYSRTGSGTQWTTTIQDPPGDQTVIQFQEATGSNNFYETQRTVSQLINGTQTLLQTTNTCYNGASSPCTSTAISLPISSINKIIQLPGSSNLECKHSAFFNSFGMLTEQDDYDYGSGAPPSTPIRKTLISYAALGNNINAFAQTVTVQDGNGHTASQTTYNYDETSVVASSGTPQHLSVSGSRGNLTSIVYTTSGTATLKQSFTYFDTGNVQTATDVNNAQTTFNYPDSTSTCGNTFPTSVTEAISGLSKSMVWNCIGGLETSATDENGKTVSTTYSDANFWRPASATDQLSNQANFTYAMNPASVESSLVFNSSNSTADVLTTLDVLGRTHVTQRKQSPSSATYDSVETDYDSLGRPSRTTVPYSGTIGQTNGTGPETTQTYDALNRALVTTDGGNGTVTLSYPQNDILQIVGPAPSGENQKQRQSEYNPLGELTSVCEITGLSGSGTCGQTTSATGYWTKYTYDGAGRLLTVSQNAQSTSQVQTRTYAYDELGRMTSEANPETGTKSYVYDSDSAGKCPGTYNGDLIKKTDAAGNVSCYAYDALHRITSITYSGPNSGNTPSKFFVYDSATVNSQAMANAKARIAEAYTCISPCSSKITDEGFSYTVRGEVQDVYESTPHSSGYFHVDETYWANGAVNQISGISALPTLTYAPDGEGRAKSVSASSGQNPITNVGYNLASEPTGLTFGSQDADEFSYDPNTFRMSQYQFVVNGQSVAGTLTWNANGTLNKLAITDAFNAANTQTCNYSYDDLARIASGNCGSVWAQTFSYDAFGNITKTGNSQFQPGYNYQTNQMASGASYDANGDVLSDSLHSYAWDVETRPTTIDSITVTYDALGRMVEQNKSGTYTEIVYGSSGGKLALMSGISTLNEAFVPLPAGATAVYNASGLQYYRHPDWLGSSRFSSTSTRTMYNDLAYAPFGETYATAGNTGVTNMSFAGNNEDTTTNLYDAYFREYGIQGRWPSPDLAGIAAANAANPQSWNRYAYAMNNPLLFVDAFGLDPDGSPCNASDKGKEDPENGTSCACNASGDFCVWAGVGTTVSVSANPPPDIPTITGPPPPDVLFDPSAPGDGFGSGPGSPQTPQQKYQQCMSNFNNSTPGKVVRFGSLLSFGDNFVGTTKIWIEAIAVKGSLLGAFYAGANSAAGGTSAVTTAVKSVVADAAGAGIVLATVTDAVARQGCFAGANPQLYQYVLRAPF